MSFVALRQLARLANARCLPPRLLFRNTHPGHIRRALQIAFNVAELARGGERLILEGRGLPIPTGYVRVADHLPARDFRRGAYVMRGASVDALSGVLGVSFDPPAEFYLADGGVLVVFGQRLGKAVVVHVAEDGTKIDRYADGLHEARKQLSVRGLGFIVPSVLSRFRIGNSWALVQERLSGISIRPRALDESALLGHFDVALEPLSALTASGHRHERGADDEFLRSCEVSLLALPELRGHVDKALTVACNWNGRWRYPAVFAHGDYAFANILFSMQSGRSVSGVIDWERSRPYACTGMDALYLALFSFAHWRGSSPMAVLITLWEGNRDRVFESLLRVVRSRFQVSDDDLQHLGLFIWLMHLTRQVSGFQAWSAEQRREWLTDPGRSAGRWLDSRSEVGGRR